MKKKAHKQNKKSINFEIKKILFGSIKNNQIEQIENGLFLFQTPQLIFFQLFISFFKGLVDKNTQVKIELKNGLEINGVLTHVDYNMNFNLSNIIVSEPEVYPHLMSLKTCFIRGNSIRYIHVPPAQIDTELLQEACKKEYNK